jgi:hypothetical protein
VLGFVLALSLVTSPARAGSAHKSRLDDFYPGAPPQQGSFDEKRLDSFYPEDARNEPEQKRLKLGARIGVAVGISVLVVGAAVGGGMAAAARNLEASGE